MVSLPIVSPARPPKAPPRAVRMSLTDRCDLACIYCRPNRHDGYAEAETRLPFDAWKTMAAGLVLAGAHRVRITGGEPLLHPDVVAMVAHLATLGLDDLALTTNATRLAKLARPLRDAGLRRINVSLDTLDEARFSRMTRGGRLRDVIAGIDAARDAGFDEIKLNAVVLRGENDDELEAIVRWSWARGIVPRFLEVMAIGEGANVMDRFVASAEMRASLAHLLQDEAAQPEFDRGPARYISARHDPKLRIGFITGTSDTFCDGCDRLRVASDGELRACLAKNDSVTSASEARAGDAQAIADRVHDAWKEKPDGTTWKGCTEKTAARVSIRAIGG